MFKNFSSLKSINIPKSVTLIDPYVFQFCSSLLYLNISERVISIDALSFDKCTNMNSFEVSELNPRYKSVDGVLFSKSGNRLLSYPSGKKEIEYTIPDLLK